MIMQNPVDKNYLATFYYLVALEGFKTSGDISYLSYNAIKAAFCYGSEEDAAGVGKALAMYSRFWDEGLVMSDLYDCENLADIKAKPSAQACCAKSTKIRLLGTKCSWLRENLGNVIGANTVTLATTAKTASKTVALNITDEILAGGYIYVNFKVTVTNNNSKTVTQAIKLNGVTINTEDSSASRSFYDYVALADCNITKAGTYNLIGSFTATTAGQGMTATVEAYTF